VTARTGKARSGYFFLPFLPFFLSFFLLFFAMVVTSSRGSCVNAPLTVAVNISLTPADRYADLVPPKNPIARIKAAVIAHAAAGDPMAQLDAARVLREAADELEANAIRAARKAGATWAAIGALYGLTKQGAQQRFRPVVEVPRTKG